MSAIAIKVPDIGDFKDVPVIELLVKVGDTVAKEQSLLTVESVMLSPQGAARAEVRELAHSLGLPVWDKPAMACLSSRVPHGTPITPELLRQIEAAEDVLVELGFRQFRVRHHNELARLELPAEEFAQAIAQHMTIVNGIKAAGYRFVTLDLAGFRSGSLNGASAAAIPLLLSE